jgi:hypothetical protein
MLQQNAFFFAFWTAVDAWSLCSTRWWLQQRTRRKRNKTNCCSILQQTVLTPRLAEQCSAVHFYFFIYLNCFVEDCIMHACNWQAKLKDPLPPHLCTTILRTFFNFHLCKIAHKQCGSDSQEERDSTDNQVLLLLTTYYSEALIGFLSGGCMVRTGLFFRFCWWTFLIRRVRKLYGRPRDSSFNWERA